MRTAKERVSKYLVLIVRGNNKPLITKLARKAETEVEALWDALRRMEVKYTTENEEGNRVCLECGHKVMYDSQRHFGGCLFDALR